MSEIPPDHLDAITEALKSGNAIVCYEQCWSCKFGQCYDEPTWHTWADEDDVEHAEKANQPDPRESRCGCACAKADKP